MSPSSFFVPSASSALPNPKAVFQSPGLRITLLTDRFFRIEISKEDLYIDQPSQVFWLRNQPLPKSKILQDAEHLKIETDHFVITYHPLPAQNPLQNLTIKICENQQVVKIDDPNPGWLPGTARTLDNADGAVPLKPGLLSRSGWVQIEDTESLLFTPEGWLEPRPAWKDHRDIYFLVSGGDYKAALQDYQKIAGKPGLLPRSFLGNWWSRYWEYSQSDIQDLVERFQQEAIPLSTFIIDMDWHTTQTGNKCSGWTGFSWNRALFPDPPALLKWLHERGLATALNLHPAEGIHPHEDQYKSVAQAMGVNPEKGQPIPFDIADPRFARTYFDQVLQPLKEDGVDFWWLDWQQGEFSQLAGLDPLWWLNHLHYFEQGKETMNRPVIFSRWGGPGNHRYPIGFSGDTVISWQSLAFQPYFTASAANTAYGWWSHDIGGHMLGMEDPEMYVRWVQFGVLSPIFRLHCAKDIFIDRHPWAFDAETFNLARETMQLRHAFIPYLYTLAYRNAVEGMPPIYPLYYDWPEKEEAYLACNQYFFGSQLMAAPVTQPSDPEIGKSRHGVWFPPGEWFNFFTGEYTQGGQWQIQYLDLKDIPLFAQAGAIVPLKKDRTSNGAQNPESLEVVVFPAADGSFNLYEDDGTSQDYLQKGGVLTSFSSRCSEKSIKFSLSAASGDIRFLPKTREFTILFRGIRQPESSSAHIDGQPVSIAFNFDPENRTYVSQAISLKSDQSLEIELQTSESSLVDRSHDLQKDVIDFLKGAKIPTLSKWKINSSLEKIKKDLKALNDPQINLTENQMINLIELIKGVGALEIDHPTQGKRWVTLNPGNLPGFKVSDPAHPSRLAACSSGIHASKIHVDYFGLAVKDY